MKLVKGMLLTSMLAVATGAGAVEQAADATQAGGGAIAGTAQSSGGSGMSSNDEWACKVAMCMASPGGPTEFAECVDPIRRLQRHLAKGKPFPVCPFTGGGSGQQGSRGEEKRNGGRDPLQAL